MSHSCTECEKIYKSKQGLETHLWTSHDINTGGKFKLLQCEHADCKFTAKLKTVLTNHVKNVHSEAKHICPTCKKTYASSGSLYKHRKLCGVEEITRIKCPHDGCDSTFKLEYELSRHIKVYHTDSTELFECPQCDHKTKIKYNLEIHMWSVHNINTDGKFKSYDCAYCSFSAKTNDNLKQHIVCVHSGQECSCTYPNCTFVTTSKSNLAAHIKRIHKNDENPILTCDECDYTTKSRPSLLRHRIRKHIQSIKLYPCTQANCNLSFKLPGDLTNHLWRGHGVGDRKTFPCEVEGCDRVFREKRDYQRHLERFHDRGKEECDICNEEVYFRHNVLIDKTKMKICTTCLNKTSNDCSSDVELQAIKFLQKDTAIKELVKPVRVEHQTLNFLCENEEVAPYIAAHDQMIGNDSCSTRRRPDILISSSTGDEGLVIIVEIDEYQHQNYNPSCERGRMNEILDEFQTGRVVFIRWNPHNYEHPEGKHMLKRDQRLDALNKRIKSIIEAHQEDLKDPTKMYCIYYMFYDQDNPVINTDYCHELVYE